MPIKDKIKYNTYLKNYMQRKRDKERKIAIESGKMGLEFNRSQIPFLTWENYKEQNSNADFQDYLTAKSSHEQKEKERIDFYNNYPEKIYNVPFNAKYPKKCMLVRLMLIGNLPRDLIEIQNHCTCQWCNSWIEENREFLPVKFQGVDMWNSYGINQTDMHPLKQKVTYTDDSIYR